MVIIHTPFQHCIYLDVVYSVTMTKPDIQAVIPALGYISSESPFPIGCRGQRFEKKKDITVWRLMTPT